MNVILSLVLPAYQRMPLVARIPSMSPALTGMFAVYVLSPVDTLWSAESATVRKTPGEVWRKIRSRTTQPGQASDGPWTLHDLIVPLTGATYVGEALSVWLWNRVQPKQSLPDGGFGCAGAT